MATEPRHKISRLRLEIAKVKFASSSMGQPRHPAGSSLGGQWMATGASSKGSFISNLMGGLGFGGGPVEHSKTLADPNFGSHDKGPPAHTIERRGSMKHLAKDDYGRDVFIHRPKAPTPAGDPAWKSKDGVVTVVPGQLVPAELGGVPLRSWTAPKTYDWTKVPGQNPELEHGLPDLAGHKWKHAAAGVIIREPDGRLWLTSPTNGFGGYRHTFPKGTQEHGLTLQQTAIKEAYEETGLRIKITGVLGDFERTNSVSRFYYAERVGGSPANQGWESQALRLVPEGALKSFLNMPVDREISDVLRHEHRLTKRDERFVDVAELQARMDRLQKKGGAAPAKAGAKGGKWQLQPRWQAGSPLGGQWKTYDGEGLPKPPNTIGSAANPAFQNKVTAAYAAVKAGDVAGATQVLAGLQNSLVDKGLYAGGNYEKAANSQQKWAQQAHQYVADLLNHNQQAPQVAAKVDQAAGIPVLGAYKKTGNKPGGSNPGAIYSDGKTSYLVKGANAPSDDRAKNEVLASKLMQAAGIGAPDMHLVDLQGQHGGGLGVAAKMETFTHFGTGNAAHIAAAQSEFAVHAWLANYDAVGQPAGDNLGMKNGKVFNYDPGGALLYRAQGKPKFADGKLPMQANEWKSMRDPGVNAAAASIYGKMSQAQLQESAQKLVGVSTKTITDLVQAYGPGTPMQKLQLIGALVARKEDILKQAGLLADGTPKAGSSTATPDAMLTGALNKPAKADAGGKVNVDPANAGAHAPAPPGGHAGLPEHYLSNTNDGHFKYWSVEVKPHGDGAMMTKTWGKIGTMGQVQNVPFSSMQEAVASAHKQIAAKQAKGYDKLKVAEPGAATGYQQAPAAAPPPAATQAMGLYPPVGQLPASIGLKAVAAHEAIQGVANASYKAGMNIALANITDAFHEGNSAAIASAMKSIPSKGSVGSEMHAAINALNTFGSAAFSKVVEANTLGMKPADAAVATATAFNPAAGISKAPVGLKWNGKQAAVTQAKAAAAITMATKALQSGDKSVLELQIGAIQALKQNHKEGSLAVQNLTSIEHWMQSNGAAAGLLTAPQTRAAAPKADDPDAYLNSLPGEAAKLAANPGHAPGTPPTPNFTGPTKDYYEAVSLGLNMAFEKGDMASLVEHAQKPDGSWVWPVSTKGPNAGNASSANGKLLQAHFNKLAGLLEGKQQEAVAATISSPDFLAKVANPPAPGASKGAGTPAMPEFEKAKIPADNSNAGSHNKKVDQIAKLAADGDVKGILSLGYGSNTYGKKQAALANSALAALGSTLQVDAGQKADSHLALTGGVTADVAAAALQNTGHSPMPAPKAGKIVPKLDAKDMPFRQDFVGHNGGKGLSSDPAKNAANQALLDQMVKMAKEGDYHGLKTLTFTPLEGGAAKGISQHPSHHITSFYDGALSAMDEMLHPPTPLQVFEAKTAAQGAAAVAAQFKPKPLGTNVDKVKSNEKAGYYMALGKVSGYEKLVPKATKKVTPAAVQQGYTDYAQMPQIVKTFIKGAQSNAHTFFGKYRSGSLGQYQGFNTVEISKQAHAWARTQPAGTTIYGWKNMTDAQIHQIEKAGPGLVIQDPGPNCMSYSESATSGFGKHKLEVIYAEGAKGVGAYGSGAYSNEKEITTLPGTRFIVLSVTPLSGHQSGGRHIKLLMLPPDPSNDPYPSAYPKG